MTATACLSVEGREVLAQRLALTTAQHLAFAVQQGDGALVEVLLAPLTRQDLYALAVVLASQAPAPRSRPEDGIYDEVAVQRAAAGDVVPLTAAERAAVIRRMGRRGVALRQIAGHLHVSVQTVKRVLAGPAHEQTDLLREVS